MRHSEPRRQPNPRRSGTIHIPALDGIRGMALLGILLFHTGDLTGGWLGVDLFFVLSGFLITTLLLNESVDSGRISLASFWARRARRLLPAVVALLLAIAIYAAWFAPADDVERFRREAMATLFYIANWNAIWSDHDYWKLFLSASPLEHTWSLAIEEQFYLIWPIIVLWSIGGGTDGFGQRKRIVWVAAALSLASAIWMARIFSVSDGTARAYFGSDTRAFEPLIGALLAGLLYPATRNFPAKDRRSFDYAALLATALLGVLWAQLSGTAAFAYRGGLLMASVAAALLIAGVVLSPKGFVAACFSQAPLRWLGRISYGAYLWHWPLFLMLSPNRVGFDGWSLTGLRLLATFLVAEISFRAIEQPARRAQISNRTTFGIAGASALAVFLTLLPWSDFADKATVAQHQLDPSPKKVLLVGDSLAKILGDTFDQQAAKRGWQSRNLGRVGCPMILSDTGPAPDGSARGPLTCKRVRRLWSAAIEEFDPDFVLVLVGGNGKAFRNDKILLPCDPEYQTLYAKDLRAAVTRLGTRAATVVLTTAPPHLTLAGMDESRRKIGCMNEVRQAVANTSPATQIDLAQWACPNQKCPARGDGIALRSDGVHYRGQGAVLASDWLLDQLMKTPTRPSSEDLAVQNNPD